MHDWNHGINKAHSSFKDSYCQILFHTAIHQILDDGGSHANPLAAVWSITRLHTTDKAGDYPEQTVAFLDLYRRADETRHFHI